MKVTSYWDSLFIVDDALSEDVIEKIESVVSQFEYLGQGEVLGGNPEDTKYSFHFDAEKELDFALNAIMELGIVKLIDQAKFSAGVRYHQFCEGDKMGWHVDSNYDLAMTFYLNECDGGQVEFLMADDDSQLLSICPKRNRLIISDCSLPHSVQEVIKGVRKSIQVFFKFAHK